MPVTLRLSLVRSPMVWFGAAMLGFILGVLVPGNPFVVVPLLAVAVLVAAMVVVRLLFPPVVVDLEQRSVRLGGADVSIATIDRVTRRAELSSGAAYLTYRLHSSDGPSARVLVAGRPVRGLDEAGVRALREVIAFAPIRVPEGTELTDRQAAIAANLQGDRGAHPAGREVLLAELDELLAGMSAPEGEQADDDQPEADRPAAAAPAAAPPVVSVPLAPPVPPAAAVDAVTEPGPIPEPGRPAPTTSSTGAATPRDELSPEAAAFVDAIDADQEDADEVIANLPVGPLAAVLVGILAIVLGSLALAGGVIAGVVVETTTGDRTQGDVHAAIVAWVFGGIAAGLAGAVCWSIGADLRTAQHRRAAAAWLDEADADRRERGLAQAFWPAEGDAANRMLTIAWFTGLVVALAGALALVVLLIEGQFVGIAFAAFVVAAVSGVLGVRGWIVARRRRSAASARLAVLIDRRIELEQAVLGPARTA
ncbi:hypothetical protein [Agromyces mangrovi Wang et al. 2018]|uniref:hypothetical protein n=1 Tax=Agromyces mangrovi TaxID=1858653 RepID=UPI00257408D0|nr:hypothetical protein [Agromyces mangrovi]BDZ65116.1 hypothetical protein GCM10025877_20540 [Agromyces mangrovi]